ncbi:TrbG/VirB9 family P-type conjugative transfer protein [Parvimonas micra]
MNIKRTLLTATILAGTLLSTTPAMANDGGKGKVVVTKKEVKKNTSSNIITGKQEAVKRTSTIFNYAEDNVYEIYTKADFITTIKLEADEDILYIVGGNTEAFLIDQTRGGKDGSSLVYIKPLFEDLDTNIVITTDKRVYFFYVKTSKTFFNSMVRFQYPYEREIVAYANEIALNKINNPAPAEVKKNETLPNISMIGNEKIDLKYNIKSNNAIAPDLVYNNGLKTYVRLKKGIQEMPILEVIGADGKVETVNMRVDERDGYKFFIIDKIVNKGQLKLGKETAVFERMN